MEFRIKDIVKHNLMALLRGGNAYSRVGVPVTKSVCPALLPELGSASIFAGMKAISMMRSIPKALEDNTFVNSA